MKEAATMNDMSDNRDNMDNTARVLGVDGIKYGDPGTTTISQMLKLMRCMAERIHKIEYPLD